MIEQTEIFRIPNPCKRICQMNNKGYCIGCFRSREERLQWNQYNEFQKQLVVNLCEKRRKRVLENKQAKQAAEEAKRQQAQLHLFIEEPPTQPELF